MKKIKSSPSEKNTAIQTSSFSGEKKNWGALAHIIYSTNAPWILSGTSWFGIIRILSFMTMVAYLALWHFRVTGHLNWQGLAALTLYAAVCIAYGQILVNTISSLTTCRGGLALQLLLGFFTLNTLMLIASLLSPLGMLQNFAILAVASLTFASITSKRRALAKFVHLDFQSLVCVVLSGAAATLWTTDSQPLTFIQGQTSIYRTWQDIFFHASEISSFAQAQGANTIHNIRSAEAPPQLYHYASYLSASAISILANVSAIDAYASFQLPFGIFLTGLAAFSLMASIWGPWPAIAALAAAVLAPDAYQQGFQNKHLSYYFLSQVNLGSLYGIACVALSWIFVYMGCRDRKITYIFIAYIFLFICLLYKAHIFVANAFLILIYPCLFFKDIKNYWRVVAGVGFTAIFVIVVWFSQTIQQVPVLLLDGSGAGAYIVRLLNHYDEGIFKDFFSGVFLQTKHHKIVEGGYATAMILISSFGYWALTAPLVALAGWMRRVDSAILALPALIIANYLIMSMGLAMDTRGIGAPEELLNRPMVWAYFFISAWTAGGAYYLTIGDRFPRRREAQVGLFGLLCIALASPIIFAKNLQTLPVREGFANYEQFNSIPLCLIKSANYIRDNSLPGEIMQDSTNDRRYIVSALTERQIFAGENMFGKTGKDLQEKLNKLEKFKSLSNITEIKLFAKTHKISWYLLRPESQVSWPSSLLEAASFKCGEYKVYNLIDN